MRFSVSTNEPEVEENNVEDINSEDFITYTVETVGNDQDHVIRISYGGIDSKSPTAQRLQEILEGGLGARATSLLSEKRGRSPTKPIIELRFEEERAAKLLEEKLKGVFKKKIVSKMGK